MNLQRSSTMSAPTLRDQVRQIADQLPADATWEDVRYQIELRASIERGLSDVEAGRVVSVEDLMAEFGVLE